jgi:hypothetical protein
MRHVCALLMLPCFVALADDKQEKRKFEWIREKGSDARSLHRVGQKTPLAVFNDPDDGRPYVHPIHAPDGKGVLTEVSPDHHKHQTGLYVGFVKVNGRDYFHNRGKDYFKWLGTGTDGGRSLTHAGITNNYDLLDKDGEPLIRQVQHWNVTDRKDHLLFDGSLKLTARRDVVLGKHDYGGLFLRMPWKQKTGGKAVNSEGDENAKAEGKEAKWVDVGTPIEGRKDWGHVAILDHKDNPRHPVAWRVDGQLGVGPALTRAEDYKLKKGDVLTLKYRLVVYTGDFDKKLIEKAWKEFTEQKK